MLTKKQSAVTKIMGSFVEDKMQSQYSVLGYRVNLYLHDCTQC